MYSAQGIFQHYFQYIKVCTILAKIECVSCKLCILLFQLKYFCLPCKWEPSCWIYPMHSKVASSLTSLKKFIKFHLDNELQNQTTSDLWIQMSSAVSTLLPLLSQELEPLQVESWTVMRRKATGSLVAYLGNTSEGEGLERLTSFY